MVADAADRGDEDHAGGQAGGDDLGIMGGAAGHAGVAAGRMGFSGQFDGALKAGIHDCRFAGRSALKGCAAGTGLICLCHEAPQFRIHPLERLRIGVAQLEQHFSAAWNNA